MRQGVAGSDAIMPVRGGEAARDFRDRVAQRALEFQMKPKILRGFGPSSWIR